MEFRDGSTGYLERAERCLQQCFFFWYDPSGDQKKKKKVSSCTLFPTTPRVIFGILDYYCSLADHLGQIEDTCEKREMVSRTCLHAYV